jgi:hypothetical protein
MNSFTKDDFYDEWIGKSSSLGGFYNQCVTLFKEFLKDASYPNPSRAIGGSGGAKEIWYRRYALGYDQYFDFEQIGHVGDWFIWDSVYGWWKGVYYGHVAMLIKDNGNGTGQFLGMNQAYSQAPANVMTLSYNGSCGVLHYKGYNKESNSTSSGITTYNPNSLINEHCVATLTVDKVAVRQGSPSGNVLKRLNKGDKFEYYYKCVANGHRWVVNKDKTQFMAISGSEAQGKDLWVTFETIEEKIELVQETGIATFKVDGINVRYDSPTGEILKTVNSGEKIEYQWKYVGNGHRYIVSELNGRKIFIAVAPTEERKDWWATFSEAKEETKPSETVKPAEPIKPTETDYTKNVKGYGIDISEHNSSDIDLSKYDFVILRASYGEYTDKKFEYFANKCDELKIPYGVYCYDYALDDNQARAEAEYVLKLIKGKDIKMGVWFDMEDADAYKAKNNVLNKERCTASCRLFCDILKANGYYTGIYTSKSWIDNYVTTTYPLWIAAWNSDDGNVNSDQSDIGVMHQYTSKPFDKDVIYHDIDFYKSNPNIVDEPEKNENKPSDNKQDSSQDKINVNGINKLIEILLKIVEKVLTLFK